MSDELEVSESTIRRLVRELEETKKIRDRAVSQLARAYAWDKHHPGWQEAWISGWYAGARGEPILVMED